MGKYPVVVHYQREGKYSYIDVNVIGIPYVTSGINEHGICLSWSGANARDIKGNGTMLMFNRILEECQNLEEVDEVDKDVDRFVTVISSQAEQTGVIYDLVGDTAHRTSMEAPYIFAVNHCMSPEAFARYNTIEDLDWVNRARSDKYQGILSGEDPFTVDKAVSLLADTGFYQYPLGDGSNTINNYYTLVSTIFEPEGGAIYFATNTHYAAWSRWIKYNTLIDEVSVYREPSPRLIDPGIRQFLKLREKLDTVDYQNDQELDDWGKELEASKLDNLWVLERLTRLYLFFKKDLRKAWIYAEKLMKKYPDLEAGYRYAAEYFRLQHKIEQALTYYRKALNCPLKNLYIEAYLYEMLALVSEDSGSLDDSRRFARNALDLYTRYGTRKYMQERISELKKLTQ
jgi:tetratricopeptide (TPR) repeat protein